MRVTIGLVLLLAGILNSQLLYAEIDDWPKDSLRSRYIHEFDDRFYIKPIVTVRSLSLDLIDERGAEDDIKYDPSSNNFLGVGLYMFGLGAEISFKLPQNEAEVPPSIYGETESFDLQTNIYARKWGADLSYQRYKGLYIENPRDHYDGWEDGDPYPIRDDLELEYLQANIFYIFNNQRFSYRSPYIQADQQLRSQGSLQAGLFFSNLEFEADSSLIPPGARASFPSNESIQRGRVTTIAILPGYTYTLTWKSIYLNAAIAVGPGNLWTKFNREDSEEQVVKVRPVLNFRAAMGYNGSWFFMGLTAVNQVVSARIDNLDINSSSANIKLFFGVRFREVGILKKRIL